MTIDDAIQHCLETVDNLGCSECANEHKQLAEWLQELKKLRKFYNECLEMYGLDTITYKD